jgi:ABC-type multidrug transport system permease subunit
MDRDNIKKHVAELVNLYCEAKYKSEYMWDISETFLVIFVLFVNFIYWGYKVLKKKYKTRTNITLDA